MFKKLALGLLIATTAQAEVTIDRFDLEECLALLYISVDIRKVTPEAMHSLGYHYMIWTAGVKDTLKTLDDAKYCARLLHMFAEVTMSYYYEQKESVPTLP